MQRVAAGKSAHHGADLVGLSQPEGRMLHERVQPFQNRPLPGLGLDAEPLVQHQIIRCVGVVEHLERRLGRIATLVGQQGQRGKPLGHRGSLLELLHTACAVAIRHAVGHQEAQAAIAQGTGRGVVPPRQGRMTRQPIGLQRLRQLAAQALAERFQSTGISRGEGFQQRFISRQREQFCRQRRIKIGIGEHTGKPRNRLG